MEALSNPFFRWTSISKPEKRKRVRACHSQSAGCDTNRVATTSSTLVAVSGGSEVRGTLPFSSCGPSSAFMYDLEASKGTRNRNMEASNGTAENASFSSFFQISPYNSPKSENERVDFAVYPVTYLSLPSSPSFRMHKSVKNEEKKQHANPENANATVLAFTTHSRYSSDLLSGRTLAIEDDVDEEDHTCQGLIMRNEKSFANDDEEEEEKEVYPAKDEEEEHFSLVFSRSHSMGISSSRSFSMATTAANSFLPVSSSVFSSSSNSEESIMASFTYVDSPQQIEPFTPPLSLPTASRRENNNYD